MSPMYCQIPWPAGDRRRVGLSYLELEGAASLGLDHVVKLRQSPAQLTTNMQSGGGGSQRRPLPNKATGAWSQASSDNALVARVRSLWLEEALAAEDVQEETLRSKDQADVCIVGGGYTGLWTAIRIKELELRGRRRGRGRHLRRRAVGRNGGFALSWWSKIDTLIKRAGETEALRLAQAAESVVSEIGEFCEREGIDAQFEQDGWLWTATSAAQVGGWNGAIETAARLGAPSRSRWWTRRSCASAPAAAHVAGLFDRAAAKVHPGFPRAGLRRAAAARGVRSTSTRRWSSSIATTAWFELPRARSSPVRSCSR